MAMLKVEMAPIVISLLLIATPTVADGTGELARCEFEGEIKFRSPHMAEKAAVPFFPFVCVFNSTVPVSGHVKRAHSPPRLAAQALQKRLQPPGNHFPIPEMCPQVGPPKADRPQKN